MKVVLCAEAWGRQEAEFQHPLVGPSGRELTLQMGIGGLSPYMTLTCRKCKQETFYITNFCQHCKEYIFPNEFHLIEHWKRLRNEEGIAVTNVFNCQPPNNDLGYFFGTEKETEMISWKASKKSGGSHLKGEHFHHIKRLWHEIEDLKPTLVVALGNAACWALLNQTKITALRGTVSWSKRLNVKCLPTFHPAAILHQPSMRVAALADMAKAKRESEFPEIRRPKRWFNIIDPTEEGIRSGYEWFKRPATSYANDIETIRDQISTIGFARSASDGLVIQFRNEDFSNYWPTEELEFEAWKLAIFGLETPVPKIHQNGLFDISRLMRMGIHPRNCLHDTMLWHHSEYPELPKSLGYLASLYCDEIAWKVLHQHNSLKRDE